MDRGQRPKEVPRAVTDFVWQLENYLAKIMIAFFYSDITWTKHCKGKGEDLENKCPRLRMVWVSCEGETSADKEYMGPVFYTPNNKHLPGYPGYYFPYVNQNHYLR